MKLLAAVGAMIIVAALGAVAWKSLDYIQEVPARVEGVKAAGIGIASAFAALLLILSFIIPLPALYRKIRNK